MRSTEVLFWQEDMIKRSSIRIEIGVEIGIGVGVGTVTPRRGNTLLAQGNTLGALGDRARVILTPCKGNNNFDDMFVIIFFCPRACPGLVGYCPCGAVLRMCFEIGSQNDLKVFWFSGL